MPLPVEFASTFMAVVMITAGLILLGMVIALILALISVHADNRRRLQDFVRECQHLDADRRERDEAAEFWGSDR